MFHSGTNRCGEAVAPVRPGPEEAVAEVREQAHPPHGRRHQDHRGEDHSLGCSGAYHRYLGTLSASVVDPKLFFSDPDPTFQIISDPDPITDPTYLISHGGGNGKIFEKILNN